MNIPSVRDIAVWEGEGGAVHEADTGNAAALSGTEAQVEGAGRIRGQVNADFDRVAASLRAVAVRQQSAKRAQTEAILVILEEKRADVMGIARAGSFIHDWQEIGDQIRKLIFGDPRYQQIRSRRAARPGNATHVHHTPSPIQTVAAPSAASTPRDEA